MGPADLVRGGESRTDDVGDDVAIFQNFDSTSTSFTHDDAGNLVDDGTYVYSYDAWNRLVKVVSATDTDVSLAEYSYDGKGRRIRKVVTNSGDLDGTELYYYDGHKVIEARDGSENVVRQVVHGKRYIDEVVCEILPDGVAWVHQDANWNVLALSDFASQALERYDQTPYGVLTVDRETYFGDSDGDGRVTVTEWDTNTNGQLDSGDACWGADPSGDCRLVDFDFDGDVDATDATTLASLDSATTYRSPGLARSGVGNTRAHQGLILDPEIGSYDNRARQYDPHLKRFMQRDPLGTVPPGFVRAEVGMNLYTYVLNRPTALVDANGFHPCGDCTDDNEGEECDYEMWRGCSCYRCVSTPSGMRVQIELVGDIKYDCSAVCSEFLWINYWSDDCDVASYCICPVGWQPA